MSPLVVNKEAAGGGGLGGRARFGGRKTRPNSQK